MKTPGVGRAREVTGGDSQHMRDKHGNGSGGRVWRGGSFSALHAVCRGVTDGRKYLYRTWGMDVQLLRVKERDW